MKVKYLGPSDELNGAKRGEELTLTEAQVADLLTRGHLFEPADKRQELPEPVPTPVNPERLAEKQDAEAKHKK